MTKEEEEGGRKGEVGAQMRGSQKAGAEDGEHERGEQIRRRHPTLDKRKGRSETDDRVH